MKSQASSHDSRQVSSVPGSISSDADQARVSMQPPPPMHPAVPSAWQAVKHDEEALRSCIVLTQSLSRCLDVLSRSLVRS